MNFNWRNIILGLLVAFIWALIVYRLVEYKEPPIITSSSKTPAVLAKAKQKKNLSPSLISKKYRDPFLAKVKPSLSKASPRKNREVLKDLGLNLNNISNKSGRTNPFKLQGIIQNQNSFTCILFYRGSYFSMEKGDSIGDYVIEKVYSDYIILRSGNEEIRLNKD